MGRLISILFGMASVIAVPVQAANLESWQPVIAEAAQRFGIPASWIAAIIVAESGGDPRAVSSKGAIGLMQIMPRTWVELRARLGLGSDPFEPHDNIAAGAAYLRDMRDRYGYPGLFAAYNAGPARYDAYLKTDMPLPAETRRYLAALARIPADAAMPPAVLSGTLLFFRLRTQGAAASDQKNAVGSGDLFVPLTTVSGDGK
jgi:soluble lytic murein transglycosylase-like protein